MKTALFHFIVKIALKLQALEAYKISYYVAKLANKLL
jgi:hypothetical protein